MEVPVFIGTYTETLGHVQGRGPGIIPCALNLETGGLRSTADPVPLRNPAYLWRTPCGSRLHATSEVYDFEGNRDGSLSTLRFDEMRGMLCLVQECGSSGCGPAWVVGDMSGKWLLVANYIEGNVVVFSTTDEGETGVPVEMIRYAGCGPVASRQDASHPHAILISPDNLHAYVADLGTDQIHCYGFDVESGKLIPLEQEVFQFPPGSGPRHLLFHPNGRYLIVVLELSSEISVLERDPSGGGLRCIGRWNTVPPDCLTPNHPSEIALSRDGFHLYVANRGHDSIAFFTVSSGKLELVETVPCLGRIPRHIALSPDDRFLLVANQETDEVVSFLRDPQCGELSPLGAPFAIGTPCFICF